MEEGAADMMLRMCILACLCFGLVTTQAGDSAEHRFLWDEANAKMLSARTPGDALLAAESYARLLDAGVRNGALFHNLGVALLLADRNAEAVDMFLRAERYEGEQPDIGRNLQIAIARQAKHGGSGKYWTRTILFWHYPLPAEQRGLIAAVAFFMFWLALTIRQRRPSPGARIMAGLALAIFLVFGMSFAVTLYQEATARNPSFEPVKIGVSTP